MGEAGTLTSHAGVLAPGWWCLEETPPETPGWSDGPVLVTQASPAPGGGVALRLVQPMHPVAARARRVRLAAPTRSGAVVSGVVTDAAGGQRRWSLSPPDAGRLAGRCARLLAHRPMLGRSAVAYLDQTFGATPGEVLHGATPASFGRDNPPMTRLRGGFRLDLEASPFASWLIARGLVPASMEERWFISLSRGRLVFRRSWSRLVVFDVQALWRGERLRLLHVRVNRDPAQYRGGGEAMERRSLHEVIAGVVFDEWPTLSAGAGYTPKDAAALAALLARA